MRKEKRCVNRKPMRLFRAIAAVIGFGCLLHMAHKECAKGSDQTAGKSLFAAVHASDPEGTPLEDFHATAYCVTGITKSGVAVSPGHVAADPRVIPLGSMIYVESPLTGVGGIYQVLDTGELIKGRIIDIFMPSYERCKEFGRRMVKVKVLRYGFLGDAPAKKPGN